MCGRAEIIIYRQLQDVKFPFVGPLFSSCHRSNVSRVSENVGFETNGL